MNSQDLAALPSASEADAIFQDLILHWHTAEPELRWDVAQRHFPTNLTTVAGRIYALGLINCFQWHLEDECRSHYASQTVLAELKHNIDLSNQRRMESIDGIDDAYARRLQSLAIVAAPAPPALVTPGSLVDRISILELKRYHAALMDPARLSLGARTVPVLTEQIADLCAAADAFVQDLAGGRQCLKLYPSIKLYSPK